MSADLDRLLAGHLRSKRKVLLIMGLPMVVLGVAAPLIMQQTGSRSGGIAVAFVLGGIVAVLGLIIAILGLAIGAIDPAARALRNGTVRYYSALRVKVKVQGIDAGTEDGLKLSLKNGREVVLWVRGMSLPEARAILDAALR
jgi:hypothetical protein